MVSAVTDSEAVQISGCLRGVYLFVWVLGEAVRRRPSPIVAGVRRRVSKNFERRVAGGRRGLTPRSGGVSLVARMIQRPPGRPPPTHGAPECELPFAAIELLVMLPEKTRQLSENLADQLERVAQPDSRPTDNDSDLHTASHLGTALGLIP